MKPGKEEEEWRVCIYSDRAENKNFWKAAMEDWMVQLWLINKSLPCSCTYLLLVIVIKHCHALARNYYYVFIQLDLKVCIK